MGDVKRKRGASNQALTLTIASLANNGARECTAVDDSSTLYFDELVQFIIKTGGSGTSATGYVQVYAYGSADGGTTYGDNVTGTDANITLNSPTNLRPIGRINVAANATTYKSDPMSVAAAFRGVLPEKWGVVIENKTGGTLDATGGNHSAFHQGHYVQAA